MIRIATTAACGHLLDAARGRKRLTLVKRGQVLHGTVLAFKNTQNFSDHLPVRHFWTYFCFFKYFLDGSLNLQYPLCLTRSPSVCRKSRKSAAD
jgi:hypothetical protein